MVLFNLDIICFYKLICFNLAKIHIFYGIFYSMKNNPNYYKYIPVSTSDQEWGLWATGGGYFSYEAGDHYPPIDHPAPYNFNWEQGRVFEDYQLIYLSRGGGYFESSSCPLKKVNEGTFFMLFPHEWHRYKPLKETGWDELFVGFQGEYIDNLMSKSFFKKENPVIQAGFDDDIVKTYHNIFNMLNKEPSGYQQRVAAEIMVLLARISSLIKGKSTGSSYVEEKIKKAKMLIIQNCEQDVDLEELSNEIGMGYEHFRRSFKKITGLSPYQYHLELKISRAKEMLWQTNLSIKLISSQLSFENQYYFSRIFKKKTGYTPSEYKARSTSFQYDQDVLK
ncbi:MAG: AraC family transcriptional regulator [Planctomycetota bacterium]|nr:MAG: AraC family transcriptional regulator [Planctomycetota bacterium]